MEKMNKLNALLSAAGGPDTPPPLTPHHKKNQLFDYCSAVPLSKRSLKSTILLKTTQQPFKPKSPLTRPLTGVSSSSAANK